MLFTRITLAAIAAIVMILALPDRGPGTAEARTGPQEPTFFRIATGSISGVYYPVAGVIATAISGPPGSRPCHEGGSCGVPGLVAVAQASRGSIQNLRALAAGEVESALVQADVAAEAFAGRGIFAESGPMTGLRALARLYPEILHIVVREDSGIETIEDLRDRRVSLDLAESGTRGLALRVLAAHGLVPGAIQARHSQIGPAVDRLEAGTLDAFFFVGGYPAPILQTLAQSVPLRFLSLSEPVRAALVAETPFLFVETLPEGTYGMAEPRESLAVGALWLVSSRVSDALAHGMTQALWHPMNRRLLDQGPPATRQILPQTALIGLPVPLHPGAERYYREAGMLDAADQAGSGDALPSP